MLQTLGYVTLVVRAYDDGELVVSAGLLDARGGGSGVGGAGERPEAAGNAGGHARYLGW